MFFPYLVNQGWRWTFFLSGAPGILLGFLIILTLKEPERNRTASGVAAKTANQDLVPAAQMTFSDKAIRTLKKFCKPSLLLICLAGSIRNSCKCKFYQLYFNFKAR